MCWRILCFLLNLLVDIASNKIFISVFRGERRAVTCHFAPASFFFPSPFLFFSFHFCDQVAAAAPMAGEPVPYLLVLPRLRVLYLQGYLLSGAVSPELTAGMLPVLSHLVLLWNSLSVPFPDALITGLHLHRARWEPPLWWPTRQHENGGAQRPIQRSQRPHPHLPRAVPTVVIRREPQTPTMDRLCLLPSSPPGVGGVPVSGGGTIRNGTFLALSILGGRGIGKGDTDHPQGDPVDGVEGPDWW